MESAIQFGHQHQDGAEESTDQATEVNSQIEISSSPAEQPSTPQHTETQESPASPSVVNNNTDFYGDDPDDFDEDLYVRTLSYKTEGKFPQIPARPGFAQRWVHALHPNGEPNHANVAKRESGGWKPRNPATLPQEFRHLANSDSGLYPSAIMAQGHILCEMPMRLREKLLTVKQEKADAVVKNPRDDLQQAAYESGTEIENMGEPGRIQHFPD